MRLPRSGKLGSGKFGKLMVIAPVVIEVLSLLRRSQQAKRGKYAKARRRDRVIDTVLNQAQRAVGKKTRSRRWF